MRDHWNSRGTQNRYLAGRLGCDYADIALLLLCDSWGASIRNPTYGIGDRDDGRSRVSAGDVGDRTVGRILIEEHLSQFASLTYV